ncbi:MAG: isoprenylcysteine carboxylmethyltransferase family protein [bacterium]|nr:isoprenylcysteine carboxylmethyltransferase family protein [bacterium]
MDIRKFFFKFRSYTPVPLLILLLISSQPALIPFLSGLGLMILGEAFRLWAVAHAGGATRTRDVGAPELVTSGPFARTRNPLYLANTLIYLGVVCLAGGHMLWLGICLAFSILQYSLIVSLEEQTLIGLYGPDYDFYRKRVPRWAIRMTRWSWSIPRKADWKGSWRNENSTQLNLLISTLVFALIWYFHTR